MTRTHGTVARTDGDQIETTTVTDGGNRRQSTNPAKALLEDAAGL